VVFHWRVARTLHLPTPVPAKRPTVPIGSLYCRYCWYQEYPSAWALRLFYGVVFILESSVTVTPTVSVSPTVPCFSAMPLPRAPSRVEPIPFPVFGMSWFANPGDGTSIVAYCGGGGSARTGVHNAIVIQDGDAPPTQISTGDQVGVALHVYQNPVTGGLFLVVGLGSQVQRFRLPQGTLSGTIDVGEPVNAIAVHAMAETLAVGCDSGTIKVYAVSDDLFGEDCTTLHELQGHDKTVCALDFATRGNRIVSSAKDGTARIWQDGHCVAVLTCSVQSLPDSSPSPNTTKTPQVLVRGCAFGDLDGRVLVTVASARRGNAYLTQWYQTESSTPDDAPDFAVADRTVCSAVPISAMSMSQDASLLALGSVDGSIILWNVPDWKQCKKFVELHGLPVTCIAARPYPVPLQGEEDDGVEIHARSASADSQLGCLTMQRRAPRKRSNRSGGSNDGLGFFGWVDRTIKLGLFLWVLSPVYREALNKCAPTFRETGVWATGQCIMDDVLIAPSRRSGVQVPPY
jgi:hypothetical protein